MFFVNTMPKRTEIVQRQLTLDDGPCRLCTDAHPGEILHSCKEHMHYHARALKDDAAVAYKASLSLIFAHITDIHMILLNVLSKHYGHSVEDMLNTVMEDPDWKEIYLHPTLKRLVFFENEEPVEEPSKEPSVVKPSRKKRVVETTEQLEAPPVIKRPKIKKVIEEEPLDPTTVLKRRRGRPLKETGN